MIRSLIAAFLLIVSTQDVVNADGRESIHESAEDAQPLMPSMMAPPFEVRTADDEPFSFDPAAMEKPVVLTFFRGGWCPYCNLHLAEMRKAQRGNN